MPAASPRPFNAASWSARLSADLTPFLPGGTDGPLEGAEAPWQDWLRRHFPRVCSAPFGQRHLRLWEWLEALTPGVRPRPRVEIWPRGGAKSTTTELGVTRACVRLARRYVLYVSETQEQADKHVVSIASLMERCGVERAVNQYGTSKGWRRQELRTRNGFNVSSYGLDTAARGVKLDEYRPDLIVFDDLDSQDDTERITRRKIDALTTAIIPAGSSDCAMLFVQNLIHEESIFAQLVDGRADFLHDREPAYVEPAVRGLETEKALRPDGLSVYRITAGEATWEGQSLAICERQINDWGLRAFQREAQHQVRGASGYFFDTEALREIEASEVPRGLRYCRGWDLAATQGGGDYTAGVLLGVRGQGPETQVYVVDVVRDQWGSDNVRKHLKATAEADPAGILQRLPQDPAQAGKWQAEQLGKLLAEHEPKIGLVTGRKAVRARGFADAVNRGNVFVVRAPWTFAFTEELRKFREDETHAYDDQVDAASDAYNELAGGKKQINDW